MKIYFFLGDLSSKGGIERVTVALANGLSKFYDVTIISLYSSNEFLPFMPDEKVKVIYVNKSNEVSMYSRKLSSLPGLIFDIKYIYKKIKEINRLNLRFSKEDILISCDVKMSLMLYFLTIKSCCKKIAIEHFEHDVGNPVLKKIRQYLYPQFNAVVSQTSEDRTKYLKWLPHNKHKIIPNIVSVNDTPNTELPCKEKVVIAVGRLTHQKGFDLLLQAWALSKTNGWCLKIIGDGEDYSKLMSLIDELNIKNAEIIGFQKNINLYYESSEIFVLSSRFEGLGMVLIEALSYGLACISFDCPAGPKSIISSDNGVLIPTGDIKKLSQAISLLIDDEIIRKELQEKAVYSIEKYKEKNVIAEWRELINEIA